MDVTSYLLGKKSGGGSTPTLQNKSIIITENGTTNVVADSGYDGLSKVEVTTNVSGGGANEYFKEQPSFSSSSDYRILMQIIKKVPVFTIPSSIQDFSSAFEGAYNLLEIPLIDTSRITNMNRAFRNCQNLVTMPSINTHNVTNFNTMFQNDIQLVNFPVLDFSNATGSSCFSQFVANCRNLSDASLDNILQSCLTTTSKYTGAKTLKQLGISDTTYYPASRIEALPHYQDFVDAGWTIGY